MASIRKITVNNTQYDIIPKTDDANAATLFLRGDGQWATTPGQEIFITTTEPEDSSAKLWLRT